MYRKVIKRLGVVSIREMVFFLIFVVCAFFLFPSASYATLTDGLVGHWTFDGKDYTRSSGDVVDRSGNSNTCNGGAGGSYMGIGKIGQALLSLDTFGVYMVCGSGNSIDSLPGGSMSLSMWIKPGSLKSGVSQLLHKAANSLAQSGWYFGATTTSGDRLEFIVDYNTTDLQVTTSASSFDRNIWQHLVLTYTGSGLASDVHIYVDGVETAYSITQNSSGVRVTDASQDLTISNDGSMTNYFTGGIDDVRIYDNRILTTSEIRQLYSLGATKLGVTPTIASTTRGINNGLVGHWTFDGKDTVWTSATAGTVRDISGNGNTGTLTNMKQSTSSIQGKIGQASRFDGVNQSIDLGDISAVDNSGITISAWIKTSQSSGTYQILTKDYTGGCGGGGRSWQFRVADSKLSFIPFDSCVSLAESVSTKSIGDGKWHHVVGTWDGTTVKTFIDSNQDGSALLAGDINPSSTNVYVGQAVDTPGYWNGSIDDARIYNRALSSNEITQLYNLGVAKVGGNLPTVATTTGTNRGLVAHWTFDGKDTVWTSATAATTLDRSGNGLTATLNSMSRSSSTVLAKSGQGLTFDGSNDYLRTSANSLLDLETARTVALWMKVRDHSGTYGVLIAGGSLSCCGVEWYIAHDNQFSTNKIDVKHHGVSQQTSAKTISPNKWYHVTWTYDGTTSRLYIDGLLESSTAMAGPASEFSNDVHIGSGEGPSSMFPGILDDVRLYNRALTAGEVAKLYQASISTTR